MWITVWRSLSQSRHIILPLQTGFIIASCLAILHALDGSGVNRLRACAIWLAETVAGDVTSSATWQCLFTIIKVKLWLTTTRRHVPESRYNSMYSYPRPFFLFRWRYSPLWALACRTMSLHFVLSVTISLHLLTLNTWRSLSTSSLHPFLGLPLRLVPSSSGVKIFLGILSSSILSRWPSLLILCPLIHFTIFSLLFNSSSSRFVLMFHSPSSYLGPYILLNIFL